MLMGGGTPVVRNLDATALLPVRLRDLLGTLNHEHGPGQDARIGPRAVPGIGEAPVLRQALPDDLLRRAPVQDALPAGVVGRVEAREQSLQVAVAGDGDAEHLPLHATIEALDHAVRARRVGLGLAVLDAEVAAALLEALGREAAAAIGQEAGDAEGKGRERLLQEGLGAGLGLLVLDRQVDPAGAPVDGDEQEALAALAVGGPQLGQVLHVHVDEAEHVLPELARRPLGRGRGRPAAQPLGLQDAVDVVAAEVREEVAHHEGEVVEREAGRAAQGAHHRPLLLARLPRQLVRAAGAVPAVGRAALAPLANGLGTDAVAPGQLAAGLGGAGDLGARPAWCGRWGGSRASGRSSRPGRSLEAVEAPRVGRDRPTRLIPTTFRSQTASITVASRHDLRLVAPARFGGHGWRASRSRMRWSCGPARCG